MRTAALALACLLAAGQAKAMTAWGTIITNVATITMTSGFPDFVAYEMPYSMTCRVMVGIPGCMTGNKTVSPTVQEPGGTLTYTIWAVNCSAWTSAFNITLTDQLQGSIGMDGPVANWPGASGGLWYISSGSNNVTWAANYPAAGQGTPYYLRFVLDQLGPAKSGFVQYTVRVL